MFIRRKLSSGLFIALSLLCPFFIINLAAQESPVLEDPIAHGAWLYRGRCMRCHQDYDRARLAENYNDKRSLVSAIGNGKCQVVWSRRKGGELNNRELTALADYFFKWEELGEEPRLQELVPFEMQQDIVEKKMQPIDTLNTANVQMPEQQKGKMAKELPPPLAKVIERFPVAAGAWLYTNNCYRCHLTYETARMGKNLARKTIYRAINEGKTSTQMKPFSRMLGGELKNNQIKNIVEYIMTWEKFGESPAIAVELMTPPAQDPADFIPLRLTCFKPISGDIDAGKKLYLTNCLPCHGVHGEGYIGVSLRGTRWCIRKDLLVKSVLKEGIPGSLMKSWSNTKGGPFSAKNIDDVVSYIIHATSGKEPVDAAQVK